MNLYYTLFLAFYSTVAFKCIPQTFSLIASVKIHAQYICMIITVIAWQSTFAFASRRIFTISVCPFCAAIIKGDTPF